MSYLMSFCSCVFQSFSIAITSLGEGRANLILVFFVRLFDLCLFGFVGFLFLVVWEGLRFVIATLHGLFSYPFFFDLSISFSSWCLGRAAVCDCGILWTFLLHFFRISNCKIEHTELFFAIQYLY